MQGRNRMMKYGKVGIIIACFLGFLLLCFILGVCSLKAPSRDSITKKALKEKYNEDFNVFEYVVDGPSWTATVSPKNRPELLFEAKIRSDGTVSWDDYCNRYMAYIFQETLRNDLSSFFPDSYIRVSHANIRWEGKEADFRAMTIEEIIDSSSMEGIYTSGCYVDIYIDKETGTACKYAEEYEYFTTTIDEYIQSKKMIPVIVKFILVDHETKNNVIDYFSKDIKWDTRYEAALGVEKYEEGIYYRNQDNLGNPPNVVANFKITSDNYIGDFDEYLRRREALDNVE